MRITIAALLVIATPAHADDDYGEQIAVADAAGVALAYGAHAVTDRVDVAAGVWIGAYALIAPVVHLAHGREDRAALSFGMRAAPLLVLASVGRCGGGEEATGCIAGTLLLGVAGAIAATAVDIFAVSDEPAPMMLAVGGTL